MNRITRKKIVFQSGQCTYTDLDVLLRYSKEISLGFNKENIFYLFKIVLVCSTTIVYLAMTSFVFTTFAFYMKHHLVAKNDISNGNCSNETTSNQIIPSTYFSSNNVHLKQQKFNVLSSFRNINILREKNSNAKFFNTSCYLNGSVATKNNEKFYLQSKIQGFIKDSNQRYIVSLENRIKLSKPLFL